MPERNARRIRFVWRANCLWGGGRVGAGDVPPRRVLALLRAYGISARLTFSNSLLGPEHLADARCNRLCRLLAEDGNVANGVIVHSDLLADYLRQTWPQLYLVSSTTKVLTDFPALRRELERPEFRYVVPDFRLNIFKIQSCLKISVNYISSFTFVNTF